MWLRPATFGGMNKRTAIRATHCGSNAFRMTGLISQNGSRFYSFFANCFVSYLEDDLGEIKTGPGGKFPWLRYMTRVMKIKVIFRRFWLKELHQSDNSLGVIVTSIVACVPSPWHYSLGGRLYYSILGFWLRKSVSYVGRL